MDNELSNKILLIAIEKLSDDVQKVARRQDITQKSIDTMNTDRNMFEDMLTRLSAVEHALHLNKDHQTEMNKNIKEEIREAGAIVENTVHDIKDKIDNKTIVVKSTNENIVEKIMKKLGGEKKI